MNKNTFNIITLGIAFMLMMCICQPAYSEDHTPDYYEANVREHFRNDRWQQGKALLDEGMKTYGTMSVMNELAGWYYYHVKNYDKARFHLIKSLRDDTSNTHARELLVNVEEETKNYSSAICYINELLEENPYSRGLWRRKINMYRKQGNEVEADRLLTRLRQIYPNDEGVKKEYAGLAERNFIKNKEKGDLTGQIDNLKELIKYEPKNTEYYLALTNAYLKSGRTTEALETATAGANVTRNPEIIRKKASILAEEGRYNEAMAYLRECQKTSNSPAISSMLTQLQMDAAQAAQMNDPYTAMAKVYDSQHSAEALNYLVNTSIARGYYDDAINYLRDARKSRGETEEILYKEYIVHRRLGNRGTALGLLTKLYNRNPHNSDVMEDLAQMRYEQASELMYTGQYSEAIPNLQFAADMTADEELKKSALSRLYNCYYETKQYSLASDRLDQLYQLFDYEMYTEQKARLFNEAGRTKEALATLANAYNSTSDPAKLRSLSYTYEELALPYIKNMLQKGMTRQAYLASKEALLVCPTSIDLLHQGITTADLVGNTKGYEELVAVGRARYPEDPFFMVKEAAIYSKSKNYEAAMNLLRPELNYYPGDTTLVKAYSENSMLFALNLSKEKDYLRALSTIDSALVFNAGNRELLYTKGIIYESMHEYDSAYYYQKYYQPTLTDYREHGHHLEELKSQGYRNELTLQYQESRPGDEDIQTANAALIYTRKEERNDYTFSFNYAGRDGMSSENLGKEMESGGTGIQLGFDWTHRFRRPWTSTLGAAWSSKYFPQLTFRAALSHDFRNDWTGELHANVRRLHAYSRNYKWMENTEWDGINPDDRIIYAPTNWQHNYRTLWSAGINVMKTIDLFNIAVGADAFYMSKRIYFNGNAKMQFFPKEGSRSHIFAVAGLGTAPQSELLDSSLPVGFKKLNTYVGAGGLYVFNQHLAGSLSGTWYTMYRSQSLQAGIYDPVAPVFESTTLTNYKNQFYWQANIIISF